MLLRSSMLSSTIFSPPRAAGDPPGGALDPAGQDADESRDPGEAAADPPAEPAAGAGEAAEPAEPAATSLPDWRDREIKRKHAQVMEAKRREEELRRENEELRGIAEAARAAPKKDGESGEEAPAPRPAPRAADPNAVREEAARMVARDSYDRDCNAANAAGIKNYGKDKWNAALDNVNVLGGLEIEVMAGLLATDDPARVIYELGSNPDEYHRVMALPPAKRLNEMAKIAAAPALKKKTVSDAPAPVDSIQGRGARGGDELDDELDDATWYARREKQKLDKWKSDRAAGRV